MAFFREGKMFRVAEFEKVKGRQIFKKFAFKGYKLDQEGNLSHYKKKISIKDKRRKNYVQVNMAVGQADIKGHKIYEEDYVFDYQNKVNGIIKYYKNMGAYILRVDAGKIEIPYSVLDKDELKLEVLGNVYADKPRKNKWKD